MQKKRRKSFWLVFALDDRFTIKTSKLAWSRTNLSKANHSPFKYDLGKTLKHVLSL